MERSAAYDPRGRGGDAGRPGRNGHRRAEGGLDVMNRAWQRESLKRIRLRRKLIAHMRQRKVATP